MSNKWILRILLRLQTAFIGFEAVLAAIFVVFCASAILLLCLTLVKMKENVDANLQLMGICQAQIEYIKVAKAEKQTFGEASKKLEVDTASEKVAMDETAKSHLVTMLMDPAFNGDLSEVNAATVQAKKNGTGGTVYNEQVFASMAA